MLKCNALPASMASQANFLSDRHGSRDSCHQERRLWIQKPRHEEVEECIGSGAETNIDIGSAGLAAGEAFCVYDEVERCGWAERRFDGEGHGHGVVERGCERAPLCVQEDKLVGEWCALFEEN